MGLVKQLTDRNIASNTVTKSILEAYGEIFDDVFESLHIQMKVKWISIEFHYANPLLINVIGVLSHSVGDIMHNDYDEEIFVDETNVKNYSSPIRMILPIHCIEDRDINALVKFISETSRVISDSSQEEFDIMLADDIFLAKTFTAFKDLGKKKNLQFTEKKRPPIEHEGFNLRDSDLDEAQIQFLRIMRPEGQA
jgi:hypothetical protein